MTKDINADLLRDTTHRILVADLVAKGNVLSPLHSGALLVLAGTMADYAAKLDQGRKAVALPTGMGKTSAVIAFILALEELGYVAPIAVAASKVEALADIKRELLTRGVAEELIGLKHRVPGASLPSTENADRRYMLVTHSRVANTGTATSSRDYELFGRHQGRDRALMVWDETLMRSEATGIDVRQLRAASASVATYKDASKPELSAAIDYLVESLGPIDAAMAHLQVNRDPDAHGAALNLSPRTDPELQSYSRAILSAPIPFPYKDSITTFFGLSQEPLRVLAVGTSEGLIWSREAIPQLLRNVLILDASYPIRSLVQLDSSISEVTTYPASVLKRFDDVKIVQLLAAGGRSSINRTAAEGVKERTAVVNEALGIIKSEWANSRGILVFTFKQNQKSDRDHFKDLQDALRASGLDPDTPVDSGRTTAGGAPEMKPKLQGLTYGQETSLNGLEFCDVVILAGVLHRSELDVAAAMKGQIGALSAPTPAYKVKEVIQSEVAHVCYQALSRGSCRRIVSGKALPMKGYLIHRSHELKVTLDQVMPGAAWEFRTPSFLKPANADDAAADNASAILDYLRKLPETVETISCRAVSSALGTDDDAGAKKAFTRGGSQLEELGSEWAKVGQTFKRGAGRYGFTDQTANVDSP